MRFPLSLLSFVLLTSGCGGSGTPTQPSTSGSVQEKHASLTTSPEAVELVFPWAQATTSSLSDPSSRVAQFTFAADPPDPKATIERILVNGIHSESACPADFQLTLISPAGHRFALWNNEGPCNQATREEDAGGTMNVNTFVEGRELTGVAGEPLCVHCTDPVTMTNRPDDYWKWQMTTRGLSKGTSTSASHPPSPITGTGDLGMTVTFYYRFLSKG